MHTSRIGRNWFARMVIALVGIHALVVWTGCGERVPPKVVVDAAIDKEVGLTIFHEFTNATGVKVRGKYGVEVGGMEQLVAKIVAERDAPRCDLFWNDEILQTLALDRAGLLRSFAPDAATEFPASARTPRDTWYAIALDARVLLVNTNQIAEARRPDSIYDLTDPQWYERAGVAKPVAGLSATHAACLFQRWGDAKAREFFEAVKRNARIMLSDEKVAHAVGKGSLAFGLTNASDAVAEIAAGAPVTIVYPDQSEYGLGTLFVPMTVALVKDSPHPEQAEQLLNFLLSEEVARRLAEGPNAFIPLHAGVAASPRVKTPAEVRPMSIDFSATADHWPVVEQFLRATFASAD